MLIPSRGQDLEHARGHAGVRAHAEADDGHLDDVLVVLRRLGADLTGEILDERLHPREVRLGDGEGDVGARLGRIAGRRVLDDHVDGDVLLGEAAEDLGDDAGLVVHACSSTLASLLS